MSMNALLSVFAADLSSQSNATSPGNVTAGALLNTNFMNESDVTGPHNWTNVSCLSAVNLSASRSAAEYYWKYKVLGATDDTNIGNIGEVQWHLAGCLLLAWVLVYVCIIKGVKSSGKVVYFTATFPYVILFILLVRGATLPGAIDGVKYYLQIDSSLEYTFGRLAHGQVWKDAAIQILFSLGPGFGSLIMLGSYNKFHNKCNWDAVIVTVINCGTSLFAGFVVFSILGFMAEELHVDIAHVADDGPGLAFIVYPAAVAKMPAAPFWSICFFFMLVMLGLDSQFVGVECIVTALVDEFDVVRRWKKSSTLIVCCLLFLAGIPCTTQGGIFVVELIDKFTLAFPLLIVVLLEVLIISYIYGLLWFSEDIEHMLGSRPNFYWLFCWAFAAPLLILFVLIFACVEGVHLEYDGYQFPAWAEGIGWLLAAVAIAMIPVWALITLQQSIGSCQALCWLIRSPASVVALNLRDVISPSSEWGPALECNRHRTHQSVRAYRWISMIPRALLLKLRRSTAPNSCSTVADHEGHCFVNETSFYHQHSDDSHTRY